MARILIVDDSSTSRSISVRLLGGEHEVTEAASGQAGLDSLAAGNFDLIFLDLLMPGMSGFEVLTQLAARGSTVPVIVVTADIQNSTRAHATALGAAGLVTKPVSKESLASAIAATLHPSDPVVLPILEPVVKAAIEGLMQSSIEKAASVLNTMLSSPIALAIPNLEMISADELYARFAREGTGRLAAIEMRCAGGVDASIELLFASEHAAKLADCVMGASGLELAELDSMRSGALCEIGNIVINAVFGTISNALGMELSFTLPLYLEGKASTLVSEIRLPRQGIVLLVKTTFEVKDLSINGDIIMFLSLESFESLSRMLKAKAAAQK